MCRVKLNANQANSVKTPTNFQVTSQTLLLTVRCVLIRCHVTKLGRSETVSLLAVRRRAILSLKVVAGADSTPGKTNRNHQQTELDANQGKAAIRAIVDASN